ncbi:MULTISPECIES: hypothetical protein [Brevibacillus]|uniref:hypothetical protein n=1 Tax=Brevibacillus TaxID=55080 RepID=UPI000D10FCBF|nr:MULTISPECIES: hypothetical protein [Brevibacillus]MED1943843.1 hypothetical protein [Brevibacillus formosus]MED1999785.1 hypothetical protein [Brevibacillus formosus]MED2082078.1 hypothetical protein [Brevibacillus formosus]PSK18986.1 hypothetical protein C7R94_09405 [Brevibacillus sp. NRRL NRS-603]
MFYRLLLSLSILCAFSFPVHAQTDIGRVQVDPSPYSSLKELVKKCDLIVIGQIDSNHRAYPTGRTIPQGKIVNYTQSLHVTTAIKGSSSRRLTVISTGVEPLPDASSPLNLQYPGPLAEGNYLLFLRKVSGSQLYSTAGLWQGVYPISQGKTIALTNLGFSELNQLSQEEVVRKITAISR